MEQDAGKNVTLHLTLDRSVYPAETHIQIVATLTLRPEGDAPVVLHYPDGQAYDLTIHDSAGREIFRWSKDKFFAQALRTETVGPGEKNYIVLAEFGGLPAGRYTAVAWVTAADFAPNVLSAQMEFQITSEL